MNRWIRDAAICLGCAVLIVICWALLGRAQEVKDRLSAVIDSDRTDGLVVVPTLSGQSKITRLFVPTMSGQTYQIKAEVMPNDLRLHIDSTGQRRPLANVSYLDRGILGQTARMEETRQVQDCARPDRGQISDFYPLRQQARKTSESSSRTDVGPKDATVERAGSTWHDIHPHVRHHNWAYRHPAIVGLIAGGGITLGIALSHRQTCPSVITGYPYTGTPPCPYECSATGCEWPGQKGARKKQ
jgi:hypothetical protein